MPGPLTTRAAAWVIAATLLGAVVLEAPAQAQEEPAQPTPDATATLATLATPVALANPATPVERTPTFTG
jgi:hypothetical protein